MALTNMIRVPGGEKERNRKAPFFFAVLVAWGGTVRRGVCSVQKMGAHPFQPYFFDSA